MSVPTLEQNAERIAILHREHFSECQQCHKSKTLAEMCETGIDLTLKRLRVVYDKEKQ